MYDILREWEAREKERERFPRRIMQQMSDLLRSVDLHNFYKEATSLRGNSALLQQLIHHWGHGQQAFKFSNDSWYQPTKEDMYYITGLARRGENQPWFPKLPINFSAETQMIYVQRYVILDIIYPTYFQVVSGKLRIDSFTIEVVRCLSLIVTNQHTIPLMGRALVTF